jgi:L-ascorbate metabolism protein UlaG (beta-lactamase superfamily)
MEIKYLGHSSFYIKGKNATVVTDPFDSEIAGIKFPKHIEANIVTVSHDHKDHNAVANVEGSPFVVHGPGEFEVKGIYMVGTKSYHDTKKGAERGQNTIYHYEIDGMNLVHLGDLGHELSSADIDAIGGADILFIPVGGFYTINSEEADRIISEIEPKIVIPMHYKRPGLNDKALPDLAELSVFLKQLGKEAVVPQPKLLITKDKLPLEMQVVVLE